MPLGRAVSGIGELISNAQESPAGKVDIGVSGDGPIVAGDYWNNRRKNGGAED
ncbi:hypothetical protein [Cutibacterium modestum]|uniref:Uncharacterized protein n=1 Tax=Cutibacterium modestum TaxID=2559073 RepID=A0AAD1NWW8_9ACTN|nr:hypothetical protein [Cutibacterium modestum]EGG26211.1 hypothetical protein PA08_2176 [Cutibacterium modestum P08]BCY26199.1 hypothetical protein KB1_21890 [Cutibacterium modestum]